jgi:cytochrome c-type biogenesis protein CcmH
MRTRREFVSAIGAGLAATALAAFRASAEERTSSQQTQDQAASGVRTTMSGPMSDNAYRPVQLPPKPSASPALTTADRDELEHHLHCQCGCTLDIYTCRTTDFTCPISPAMHQDVVRLVQTGYTGPEIMDAFRVAYGERVLMAPVREGFNWAAYVAPFVALGAGATAVAVLIRRWQHRAEGASGPTPTSAPLGVEATPAELARIEAAVRDTT